MFQSAAQTIAKNSSSTVFTSWGCTLVNPSTRRARRTLKPPSYCLHKATGQGYVRIKGVDHYCGKHGTPESMTEYARLIAEHAAGAVLTSDKIASGAAKITVGEIVVGYLTFAKSYYRKNGKITDEVGCIRSAVRPLLKLYENTLAAEFGPLKLEATRQAMVDSGTMCRRFINFSVGRIRRMFRWAVSKELVKPEILLGLQSLAPLLEGRTKAKDYAPRRPIPKAIVNKVKKLVPKRTADMIDIWMLTGARPGELCMLTGGMIKRERGVWTAKLPSHKMTHKGKERTLVFGPQAQKILKRYMVDDPDERLFKIQRATASASIKAACDQLGIERFTAHWLRHTAGTRVRKDYGLDATQATLGHANASTSEIYAEVDLAKAKRVARKSG